MVVVVRRPSTVRINGEKFAALLTSRGLTYVEAASAAKVSVGTVQRMCRGRSVYAGSLRRVYEAVIALPLVPGADLIAEGELAS